MNILLLEDEYMLLKSIKTYLESLGHTVFGFEDGESATFAIKNKRFDLYILDINTPIIDGFNVLKNIKKNDPVAIVIMITAFVDINSVEKAYNLGCNEYLKKPFNLRELKIRMDKLLENRKVDVNRNIIKISENYNFDSKSRKLLYRDSEEKLSKREYMLISLFIKNFGSIITEDMILEYIYNFDDRSNSTVRSLINRLRCKLKDDVIETVRGFGYTLKSYRAG